ncbi:zinc-binding dehydrogenase [Rhizobium leguminosarum]|uniref:zinc-binding dehydrogenase n=1 Tax=Rhizobium leguminosarum TaxID=384 RepID=UPI0021B0FF31|nr:zinc-binding dehydrogenase [Rhizobium leguminosarum]
MFVSTSQDGPHRTLTEYLTKIAELIDNGDLKTRVGVILPLEEAYVAHLMLEGVRIAPGGKIVLSV